MITIQQRTFLSLFFLFSFLFTQLIHAESAPFAWSQSSTRERPDSVIKHPTVADAIKVLDAWIDYQVYWREPGLAIGIVYDHELIWAKGYGFADIEQEIPVTPKTVMRIGSISKVFTGIAVMQLRDKGKLDLDDPVRKYLPWFQVQQADPYDSPISIWHLLSHTSGLPQSPPGVRWDTYTGPDREDMIRSFPEVETSFPVGTRYKYSNLGFVVLGELVAALSGESFTEYIRNNILVPLGMFSTDMEPDSSMLHLAIGYAKRKSSPLLALPFSDTRFITPAGDGASSIKDMARLTSFLMTEGEETSPPILSLVTLREMRRVHSIQPDWKAGGGLGIRLRLVNGQVRVGHSGDSLGFLASFEVVPSERFGVIVMINSAESNPQRYVDQAFRLVGRALLMHTRGIRVLPEADSSWENYVGTYRSDKGHREHIMILEGKLTLLDPGESDPWEDRIELVPAGSAHAFRMIRISGDDVGLLKFHVDQSGQITKMALPYYVLMRVQ